MECRCGENQLNGKVARMNALVVFALGLIYLLTPYGWVVYLMLVDFFIRGVFHPRYSPVSQLNAWILALVNEKPRLIFAPPKLFANKIGLALIIVICVLTASGFGRSPAAFMILLTIFAFLEFALEFCVGCWVYDLYYKVATPDGK